MLDGWEIGNSLSPTNSADAAGDADGDGVLNAIEMMAGTDPNSGGEPSTNDTVDIEITWGDISGSGSEAYELFIGETSFGVSTPDVLSNRTVKFVCGVKYLVSIAWVSGTNDYDYVFKIGGLGERQANDVGSVPSAEKWLWQTSSCYGMHDEYTVLGNNDTAGGSTPFWASGKKVPLYVMKVERIYVSDGDSANDYEEYPYNQIFFTEYLASIGATETAYGWYYDNLTTVKRFQVREVTDQAGFADALQVTDAYVCFHGHANYGIGLAWEPTLTSIPEFFNVGSSNTYVPKSRVLGTDPPQQTNLVIEASDVATNPVNYLTAVTEEERFKNHAYVYGTTNIPYIGTTSPSNVFDTIYDVGANSFHYVLVDEGAPFPRVVVKVRYPGCDDLSGLTLRYRWLLIDGCYTGLLYADSFPHGAFFYSETLSPLESDCKQRFVQAVIEGKAPFELRSDLNQMGARWKFDFIQY